MSNFRLRELMKGDETAVVALLNAASLPRIGGRRAVVDGVGQVRFTRYLPSSSERVVVVDGTGQVVGFAYLHDEDGGIVFETGGGVHPEYWGQGVGQLLLGWATERVTALSVLAPTGIQTVLQTNLFEAEKEAIGLVTAAGFKPIREWMHLIVELEGPLEAPVLREGLLLREMDLENDWEIAGPALSEAFADHWGAIVWPEGMGEDEEGETEDEEGDNDEEEIEEDDSYSNGPGVCFLVVEDGYVAGGVLCNGRYVERDDVGRVGSVFVRPAYRRQGIARALMTAAFNAYWQRGIGTIITDTDAASFSKAPRLYQHMGMRPYRREFLYEKVIRAGRELRRLQS